MVKNRNRYKGGKRHNGYTPVHTTPTKKKKKKCDFVSKSTSIELNKQGIKLEKLSIIQKNFIFFVGLIFGFILLLLDVKDDGMFFEGLGIKFAGSLVGIVVIIISLIGVLHNKPRVRLE